MVHIECTTMDKSTLTLVLFLSLAVKRILAEEPPPLFGVVNGAGIERSNEYPFMAFITMATRLPRPYCGATIIDPGWILTAAHCVTSSTGAPHKPYMIRVGYGSSDYRRAKYANVERVILHEKFMPYQEARGNDIALIKLKSPTMLSANVKTIKLSSTIALKHMYTPKSYNVTGWGWRHETDGVSQQPTQLQVVELDHIHRDDCMRMMNYYVDPTFFCAARDDKDSCIVDHCLPTRNAYEQNIQYGIVAAGAGCARRGRASLNTRVDYFEDWINDNMPNDWPRSH